MRLEALIISLLATVSLSLYGTVEGAMDRWAAGRRDGNAGILGTLLGGSRKMFATHYFIKADAYYHKGYYPSIFDSQSAESEAHIASHMTEEQGHDHDQEEAHGPGHAHAHEHGHEHAEVDFHGPPLDWIDAFSRNFRPNHHSHLDEDGDGDEDREPGRAAAEGAGSNHAGHDANGATSGAGRAREILPWLKLSASLDPQRVQTYVVGAFFLRNMGKDEQAEIFLREGLRENPASHEILTELGKLCLDQRKDPARARNFWEAGLRHLKAQELGKPEDQRNTLAYATLLGNLAKLEESQGRFTRAIDYLTELKGVSPNKEALTRWISELQGRAAGAAPR